ncbi:MAG: molybdenum cofactor biosynthesis protein MoaE [Candidatus Fonsibacter sp.]|nr:molybdenum cofactor biosynthesis protein MoaE [Candidatus Fonsibacter sp.]
MLHVAIVDTKKINITKAEKFIKDINAGASIFFVGNIRKNNNNKNVIGITYDAFNKLVIKIFKKIYSEGIKKFKLKKAKVFIEHAKGYVPLGKPSIIIAVSCKHRSETYQLSRYLIEQIKIRAPIWKKEYYKNQKSEWLKGTSIKVK